MATLALLTPGFGALDSRDTISKITNPMQANARSIDGMRRDVINASRMPTSGGGRSATIAAAFKASAAEMSQYFYAKQLKHHLAYQNVCVNRLEAGMEYEAETNKNFVKLEQMGAYRTKQHIMTDYMLEESQQKVAGWMAGAQCSRSLLA